MIFVELDHIPQELIGVREEGQSRKFEETVVIVLTLSNVLLLWLMAEHVTAEFHDEHNVG